MLENNYTCTVIVFIACQDKNYFSSQNLFNLSFFFFFTNYPFEKLDTFSLRRKSFSLTWTIFGFCLPVTKCPFKSMTINVRSLSQPDFRPSFVHSIVFIRTEPSDLIGYTIRSLNSPTFRHCEGGFSFCFLDHHHHQRKTTTVPAPTTAADTYVSRVLSVSRNVHRLIIHGQVTMQNVPLWNCCCGSRSNVQITTLIKRYHQIWI